MAMKKIGALWLKDGQNGKYMSGTIEGIGHVKVFKNTYKKEDKHPDYTVHVQEDDQPAPRNEYQQAPAQEPVGPPPGDEIPF